MSSSTSSMAVHLDEEGIRSTRSSLCTDEPKSKDKGDNTQRGQFTVPDHDDPRYDASQQSERYYWNQYSPQRPPDAFSGCSRRRVCCCHATNQYARERDEILEEPKLPTGSVMTKHSRYGSRLDITSSGESAPSYSENISPSSSTRGNGYAPRQNVYHMRGGSSGSLSEKDKCLLDRLVDRIVRKFEDARNILGLLAIVVATIAFIIMVVLISTLGSQGHRRCARTAFCVCSVIAALSCGVFAAAVRRSVGEVFLPMTFLICLGILLSSQFDAMMGFKMDNDEPPHNHG